MDNSFVDKQGQVFINNRPHNIVVNLSVGVSGAVLMLLGWGGGSSNIKPRLLRPPPSTPSPRHHDIFQWIRANRQPAARIGQELKKQLRIYHIIDIKDNEEIQQTQNAESTVYRNAVLINKPCVYKQTAGFETIQSWCCSWKQKQLNMYACTPNERPTDTETHAQPFETYKTTENSGLPKRRPHSLLFCFLTRFYSVWGLGVFLGQGLLGWGMLVLRGDTGFRC